VKRWKFSYEQLEDSVNDDRVRRELKRAVALYVVPPESSGRASESNIQSSPSSGVPGSTKRLLKVFLCHSSGDKPAVRDLYKRLLSDGFAPWLDEEDLIAGQEWSQEIPKAVRGSDVTVVCLSRGSITKEGYVQKEIRIALDAQEEKPDGVIFIVPARLEEGLQVPARLTHWHWVDLFGENGYERLLRALRNRAEQLGLARYAAGQSRNLEPTGPRQDDFVPEGSSTSDLLRFFDPGSSTAVRLVSKRSYISPYKDKGGQSTTTRFMDSAARLLQLLNKRGAIPAYSHYHLEYFDSAQLNGIVDGPDSLVTYGSSKINVVTDALLKRIQMAYDLIVRFVFDDDIAKGLSQSEFPDLNPERRVSLVLKDATLKYGGGRDYGLIVRAPIKAKEPRMCWIIAGCGRPGSSAMHYALFEDSWRNVLWPSISPALPNAFYAVIGVDYDPKTSDKPTNPVVVDFQVFA
jgi:hypothetical protein